MAARFNLELKVGIFAFIALIILTLAVFSISEINLFQTGYTVSIWFTFASGIETGAPVRVAGIEVGEVKGVSLSYDNNKAEARIALNVWLDKDVRVPRDSVAFVNTLGLIGENYLEIIPGEDYAHLLKDGDRLKGRDPLSSDTIMEIAHKVAAGFDKVLNSIDEVLDEETQQALKETIYNLRDLTRSIKVISGRLERGEGKIGAYLKPKRAPQKEVEPARPQPAPEPKSESSQPRQNFSF